MPEYRNCWLSRSASSCRFSGRLYSSCRCQMFLKGAQGPQKSNISMFMRSPLLSYLHLHDTLLHLLPGNVPQVLVLNAQCIVEELLDLPELEEGVAGMTKTHQPED
ncbi:hypothetical protein E2C01_009706 [Portunus trituberculatus]|uniref:Uncharacterized protein n=1 Tax=Portunus trituberculatus TaxID=210409 RepID=A0A5B7D6G9_PORTR|nr:hypothetical protein [Portunus trituberculatus]